MAGTIIWNDQFYPGRGVNSQTQQTYNLGLEFSDPIAEAPGQRSQYYLETLTSTHDLMRSLNISASASLGVGAFSVSAEFELSKNTEMSSYYTYALVRVQVLNPPLVIRNPRLTQEARQLLEQRGWREFAAAYGWEYITGKVTGGAFYGLIECQTTTVQQQQSIRAQLSASYGPFKGEGEVSSELKESMSQVGLNVSVIRTGDQGPFPVSFDEMLEAARKYPDRVAAGASPVVVSALVNDYRSSVPLPPVPPEDSLEVLQQRLTLEDLGREYVRLRDYKATLDFVLGRDLSEFDDFRDLDAAALEAQRKRYQDSQRATVAELNAITDRARRCLADIRQCDTYATTVETLQTPTIGGNLMNLRELEKRVAGLETSLIPIGTIVPFSGSLAEAEAKREHGWWMCDGRLITDPSSPLTGRNTPDLRDRFLMGSGHPPAFPPGGRGGGTQATVPDREVWVTSDWFTAEVRPNTPVGVRVGEEWIDRHHITSRGIVPGATVQTVPPFTAVIYLVKVR
ncbi:hypothetical protein SAMN05660642_03070 [Geodermatophilus siccatus]|uniref:Uncharacterized protein n=1 Tax=Geodermatophilus siccatus TaxID=1137991 RepID=A0A1G9VBK9_9ACTN|nr:phage tail protein [Geodermatophilus siccatus]SDM69549.1 hypothetical protein SAMN05660642_03070 [Geodermatophilus siccatus]